MSTDISVSKMWQWVTIYHSRHCGNNTIAIIIIHSYYGCRTDSKSCCGLWIPACWCYMFVHNSSLVQEQAITQQVSQAYNTFTFSSVVYLIGCIFQAATVRTVWRLFVYHTMATVALVYPHASLDLQTYILNAGDIWLWSGLVNFWFLLWRFDPPVSLHWFNPSKRFGSCAFPRWTLGTDRC